MRKLILIGFMGAGKSTLGKQIHRLMGLPFIDLDDWIEAWQNQKVRDIFRIQGEPRFRQLEAQALEILNQELPESFVLSSGGGTPCFGSNMEVLNQMGTTIYLKVSREELVRRLFPHRAHRPLIANFSKEDLEAYVKTTLAKREPFYQQAQLHLNETELGPWLERLVK